MFYLRFSDCFVKGLTKSILTHTLGLSIPYIQIEGSNGYIIDYTVITDYLSSLDEVLSYSVRVYSYGFIDLGNGSYLVANIWGVDRVLEEDYIGFSKYVSGSSSLGNDSVIVGIDFAKKIGVGVGDRVYIVFPNGATYSYRVVGLLNTGVSSIDEVSIILGISVLRNVLGLNESICSVIVVKTVDPESVDKTVSSINNFLREKGFYDRVRARSWKELGKNLLDLIEIDKKFMFILVSAIAVLIGLGIVNVMVLVVESMKRQIGVLKAIGMGSHNIFLLFIAIGFIYGVIGYAIGSVIGLLTLETTGSIPVRIGSELYTITPVYTVTTFTNAFTYITAISVISCSVSAYRASIYKPVEVMRFG